MMSVPDRRGGREPSGCSEQTELQMVPGGIDDEFRVSDIRLANWEKSGLPAETVLRVEMKNDHQVDDWSLES